MDKRAIKNFAIEARKILIAGVTNKLSKLGITNKGIQPVEKIASDVYSFGEYRFSGKDVKSYEKLTEDLKNREKQSGNFQIAFETLVEEVAHTWFNRIIALRFMEVNDYLPERMRVLSSESPGKKEPEIITELLDTDLFAGMNQASKDRAMELIADGTADAADELYQMVFIKQCNSLNELLPDLFEKIDDYTELLFTVSYIDENGVIAKLLTIPESDFDVNQEGQVEIIGWMYQYYNTEPKDKVFARGNRKIRADEIPAATQLFTPDWIVRYMVENSLGRYYIDQKLASPAETRTEKEIADGFGWKYYLPTAEQPEDVQLQIVTERKEKSGFALQELKLLDNAMGSGHVLVYAFDVFMALYRAEGYTDREAAELIIEHNLFGLEIDKRAYQLAYFAIMMKGRQYNRRILNKQVSLNLYYFVSVNELPDDYLERLQELSILSEEETIKKLHLLKEVTGYFRRGTEIGSILKLNEIEQEDINELISFIDRFNDYSGMDILYGLPEIQTNVKQALNIAILLLQKYTAVVTNPPYLNKMSDVLGKYVTDNYKDVKTDLFSVFIKMNSEKLVSGGYAGFMTPFVWMFIKSYEELRSFLIRNKSIPSLIQMEYSAFEEATVPVCCFMIKNGKTEQVGNYFKLSDFRGGMKVQEQKVLEGIQNPDVDYFYQTNQENFTKIPGSPISFWVSENLIHDFVVGARLDSLVDIKKGMFTGNNDLFFRQWTEPSFNSIQFKVRHKNQIAEGGYIPINKGGDFCRWYGNNEFVMKFDKKNYTLIEENRGHRSPQFYFKNCVEWTKITSGKLAMRYSSDGVVNNDASMGIFSNNAPLLKYVLGFANSRVSQLCVSALNESMNYTAGDISRLPVLDELTKVSIVSQVDQCIILSKNGWDCSEISWDFKKHPLV